MGDMIVVVTGVRQGEAGKSLVDGFARESTMIDGVEDASWSLQIGWNWTMAKINLEIMQAAIASLELRGFTVAADDNKILLGGAGGL